MIDLHSHILHGIDDGARTMQDSLDMLDSYAAQGFRTVVATPHLVGPLHPEYAERVVRAHVALEPLARDRGITLARGFEIQLDPGTARQLTAHLPITLAGTGVVLVDLPFTEWPLYADAAFFAVQAAGYRIILAHPERYPGIQGDPGRAEALVARGIALQVNVGSFCGVFGNAARKSAEDLIARGLVHMVATDAHSPGRRLASVPAGLARLRQLVGEDHLRRLTTDMPKAVLDDKPFLPPIRPPRRSWWDRLPFRKR